LDSVHTVDERLLHTRQPGPQQYWQQEKERQEKERQEQKRQEQEQQEQREELVSVRVQVLETRLSAWVELEVE
jgi:spore cortex formation protein SpoVR/YcgB (stage V sporulation)